VSGILSFIICLVFIIVMTAKFRIPPFVSLISAAFLFGILEGMSSEMLISTITGGAASIFKVLGIIVFCGVVIARILRESGHIDRIVFDLQKWIRAPTRTGGLAGYLLAVPLMCCITTFVLVSPILSRFKAHPELIKYTLFAGAVGATLSFVLIYPTPVVVAIAESLSDRLSNPWLIDYLTIPLSLALLVVFLVFIGLTLRRKGIVQRIDLIEEPDTEHWRAWLPIGMPFLLIGIGLAVPQLHFLSDINVALFGALLVALLTVDSHVRYRSLHEGTKTAGLIIFDLCGAGAFGGVIAASSFPSEAFDLASGFLPAILLPFVLAALIQAAQGSRVVTAAVASSIVATTTLVSTLDPIAIVIMICGGAFMFSFVTDPFFWVILRVTQADIKAVTKNYTVPLIGAGLITMLVGFVVNAL